MRRKQHTVLIREPSSFSESDSLVMRRILQMQRLKISEIERLSTYVSELLVKKQHMEDALEGTIDLLEKLPLAQLPSAISRDVLVTAVTHSREMLRMSRAHRTTPQPIVR